MKPWHVALLGLGAGVGWLIWRSRSEAAVARAAELHAARQDQLEGAAWDAVRDYAERGCAGNCAWHLRAINTAVLVDPPRAAPLYTAIQRATADHWQRAWAQIESEITREAAVWAERAEAEAALRALAADA